MPHRIKNTENIIGQDSVFEGKIKVSGTLRIDGKFIGEELNIEHLIIGKTGKIKSHIQSQTLTVEGCVLGNLHSSSRTMLLPTAKILGDISTPELIIQNGVIWDGHCKISVDNKENVSDIVHKSFE